MRKASDIQAWVDKTVAAWGSIDCLLVNAGGPPAKTVVELSDDDWGAAFELTLLSSARMIAMSIPHMKSGASILTVTSGSVREPIPRLALSTVMRAGVAGLVKTLADELAGEGIRVNNLVPGRIDTDRVAQLDAISSAKQGISIEEVQKRSLGRYPAGALRNDRRLWSSRCLLALAGGELHHRCHPARRWRRGAFNLTKVS